MDDTRTCGCSEPPPKKPRPRSFLAYNQGFYNLFPRRGDSRGHRRDCAATHTVGSALIFAGIGSMLAAAVVLLASAPERLAPP